MTHPDPPHTIKKRGRAKLPTGEIMHFTVTDEITHPASNMPGNKIFYLQRLLFDDGRRELRLGYYIIGKKGRTAGKWVWGQFAPMMPAQDFRDIADKARRQGWI